MRPSTTMMASGRGSAATLDVKQMYS